MKKNILSLFAIFLATFGFSQTAVNFNCNDCNSVNHDLFAELDAGKVIVLTWVMPCSACIAGASNSYNTVLGYASSNPGVVKFYLADDYGTTLCSTLASWAATNSIVPDATFSNSSISMADYGGAGMPKTVVFGGPNHTVFWNVNSTATTSSLNLQNAINNALAVGLVENHVSISGVNLFPSPVNGNISTLNYGLTKNSDVTIEIYNTLGAVVKTTSITNQSVGKHESAIDMTGFNNGIYFIRLEAGEVSQTVKFVIAN